MRDNENTLFGLLAGTAIGAMLGILYAPDKGSETRRHIADQAEAAQDSVTDKSHKLHDRAIDILHSQKASLDAKINHVLFDVSYKTEDVITTLEKKLAELKTQNKKLQKS